MSDDSEMSVTEKELRNALALSIGNRSVVLAYILWFFLGALGVHRMYLNKTASGFVMAALTIVGWLTAAILIGLVPLLIVFVWWIYDAFMIFFAARRHNQAVQKIKNP